MNQHSCENEWSVLRARRTGAWTDELRLHLESCQRCQDAVLVDRFLEGEATTDFPKELPTPEQIWWNAERRRRREAAQRAALPIRTWERVTWLVGTVAAGFLLAFFAPTIRDWFAFLLSSLRDVSSTSVPVTTGALLFAGLAVTAALLMRGLGWLWAEE